MKRIDTLCLFLVLMVGTGIFMESIIDSQALLVRKRAISEANDVALILVQMLGIRELAIGSLWIQFDYDSANVMASYHRLLPILDAITWLNPQELDAWGLKTYMRMRKAHRENNRILVEESIRAFDNALQANPENWEFPFEIGRQIFFNIASPGRALPYLERAISFPERHFNVDKIYIKTLLVLGNRQKAEEHVKIILQREDIEPTEKERFKSMIKNPLK